MIGLHWEPEYAVCAECMEDGFFKDFIRRHADSRECSYCGRQSDDPIALDVDVIVERIEDGLGSEFEPAVESMPWVDGEFLFRTYDTREVLSEAGFYAGNEDLHDRVVDLLPCIAWAERDWQVGSRDEILTDSWERFSELVKHRNRYLFFQPENGPSYDDPRTPPSEMLGQVGTMLRERDLVAEIPDGTDLFRVRLHDPGEQFTDLQDLCSPPAADAEYANRMSPAGVSAFYASESVVTAIRETDSGRRPGCATAGTFRVTAPIPVVDLVNLPPVPSLFADPERRSERTVLSFLHEFVSGITRPIEKDHLEHIEYVPSQVVTEYLRERFADRNDVRPAGIRYPSTARRGGVSVVLFFTHEDFTSRWLPDDRPRPPLDLVDVESHPLTDQPG